MLVLVPLLQGLGQSLLWGEVQLHSLAESSMTKRVSRELLLKLVAGSWLLFPSFLTKFF
jgi:hypothetical protein